jgi:hypothetical protein
MMMDNGTHHQVVQLNTTQQQPVPVPNNNKLPGEPDHFLTIRLLMQGKVRSFEKKNLLFPQ